MKDNYSVLLGYELKKASKENGYSLRYVADKMGIHFTTISHWEQGEKANDH